MMPRLRVNQVTANPTKRYSLTVSVNLNQLVSTQRRKNPFPLRVVTAKVELRIVLRSILTSEVGASMQASLNQS